MVEKVRLVQISLILVLNLFSVFVFGAVAYFFMTERKRRLQLQSELEAAKIREQGRILANVDRDRTLQTLTAANLARQIAHDIRSPLTAIKMAAAAQSEISEDVRALLLAASSRLGQIADSLLKLKLRSAIGPGDAVDLQVATAISEVVAEKRHQYALRPNVQIHSDAQDFLFIRINPIEFKRVLSNLLHNAFAAISGAGRIEVQAALRKNRVLIEVKDSGHGIKGSLLQMMRGKGPLIVDGQPQQGFGVGIPHAQHVVETAHGRLKYENRVDGGATVAIELPAISPPVWFVPVLHIRQNQVVVVVDDDPSMHEVWQTKLKATGAKTAFFSSTEDVKKCLQELQPNSYICLVDYDLGVGRPTGLEFICLNQLQATSVLVTGQAEELHDRCKELQLRLLSKSNLPNLKIEALSS